jgi:hypothetical protein
MKWAAITLAGISLAFARTEAAKAADAYELVTVRPATTDASLGMFRINVATGQVVFAWGYPTTFTASVDPVALPLGEYHLRAPETLDQKGNWYLVRFDAISGRLWLASGGGNLPLTWSEITAPQ